MKKTLIVNEKIKTLLEFTRDELVSKAQKLNLDTTGFKVEIAKRILEKKSIIKSKDIMSGIIDVLY